MFKRKITGSLNKWYSRKNKKPLIIKGLRQVGKTVTAKEFAKEKYQNAFFLDFRKDKDLAKIFDGNFNIDYISAMITALPDENRLIKNSKMVPHKTILIFDEIQDCLNARSSLKYFKEDGRFDVICTGSFLGISGYNEANEGNRGIGVGSEEIITMMPMDFEEFLWANSVDLNLIEIVKQCFEEKKEIPSYLHELFLNWIRIYICVGGMPEVVDTYVTTKDFSEVDYCQKNIINNYKDDFGTHLSKDGKVVCNELEKARILDVFISLPNQLSKENKKFIYSMVGNKNKNSSYKSALTWLEQYGLIKFCNNISAFEEPLSAFKIENDFKVYLTDIGLMIGMLDSDVKFKILTNDLSFGKGMIYESLVADALIKNKKDLYYFSKSSGLEIDFVSKIISTITMLEVKAKNGNTKSAKEVLSNPKYNVNKLIKLTSSNLGETTNILTIAYYLAFKLN